ncbi:hypothetical protein FKP32DRAFT_1586804 [Trametes sanguinea]|nr:hypothetical protein FKP32DRAFT_1586804 [Trametes sanguinea]
MLMLLKPWRDLRVDLKDPHESVEGAQYYHDCRLAADESQRDDPAWEPNGQQPMNDMDADDFLGRALKMSQISWREVWNGSMAVAAARQVGLFTDPTVSQWELFAGANGVGNASQMLSSSLPPSDAEPVGRPSVSSMLDIANTVASGPAVQPVQNLGPEEALPPVDVSDRK